MSSLMIENWIRQGLGVSGLGLMRVLGVEKGCVSKEGNLFDKHVRNCEIGLGPVVVVIGHKILNVIRGEKAPEFVTKLSSEDLVGSEHEGRALPGVDDIGHHKCLSLSLSLSLSHTHTHTQMQSDKGVR